MIVMLPIAPLMIEHRLIERMIKVMEKEIHKIQKTNKIDDLFIDKAVDFIRTYADQTHHGKEEEILFRELKGKTLHQNHKKIMDELVEEHIWGRKTTGNLLKAKNAYLNGDKSKLEEVLALMKELVEFYPKHIEKEDKHFFVPAMEYFSDSEEQSMLLEGYEFDRKMIHRKYESDVSKIENQYDIKTDKAAQKRLDYL